MMLELERQNLLGIGSTGEVLSSETKRVMTPLQRMQNFISNVHEDYCHALAHAFHALSHDIYHVPNIAHSLIATVFSNLEVLPDIFFIYCIPLLEYTYSQAFNPFLYRDTLYVEVYISLCLCESLIFYV